MGSENTDILTSLKEHARYVEYTVEKLNAALATADHPSTQQRMIEEILSVDLSAEADIDILLSQIQEQNKETERMLTKTAEVVSILSKPLEDLEKCCNTKSTLVEDRAPDHPVQVNMHEPVDDAEPCVETAMAAVKQESPIVDATISGQGQESEAPEILDATAMLLRELQLNKYPKLETPPKFVYSQVLEEELAKQKEREEMLALNSD